MEKRNVRCKCLGRNPRRHCANNYGGRDFWYKKVLSKKRVRGMSDDDTDDDDDDDEFNFDEISTARTKGNFFILVIAHIIIIIIIIIITLDNAPYKMLHKLKVRALSEKTTLNKCVFKCFAKVAGPTVRFLNLTGNSFQQLGPATAKALKLQSVYEQRISKRGYDSHIILKYLTKQLPEEMIQVIANNQEKYISFNIGSLWFIDSSQFLGCGLESLVTNLKSNGAQEFELTRWFYGNDEMTVDMLTSKVIYLYEYVTDKSKFTETALLSKEKFNGIWDNWWWIQTRPESLRSFRNADISRVSWQIFAYRCNFACWCFPTFPKHVAPQL